MEADNLLDDFLTGMLEFMRRQFLTMKLPMHLKLRLEWIGLQKMMH